MHVLYPEVKPYWRQQLKVSDQHELYVDQAGNPQGVPILFIHGGPGQAVTPALDGFMIRRSIGSSPSTSEAVAARRLTVP